MGGFKNKNLNSDFEHSLYDLIIESLVKCSALMIQDCLDNNTKIANHEEKIRTHLLENYLENDSVRLLVGLSDVYIRFIPESSENYDPSTETYVGRADIKVVSCNWFLESNKDYYLIECKRIDGSKNLNSKYISEGICRFISSTPKYSSYHNRNIMFGFVVKDIDIILNVSKINDLHEETLKKETQKSLTIKSQVNNDYCLCDSFYSHELQLDHLFYNFSSIIAN